MFPIHLNYGFGIFPFYEGFYFIASILVAYGLIYRRLKKAGLSTEVFSGCFIWAILGAFFGARVFHFVFWDLHALLRSPADFFRFWEGGMSITGGLAGGGLAALLYYRHRGEDFWHHFAIASPALLLGQALGRVGCFLNGDAWGIPTRLPWGVSLPKYGTLVPSMVKDYGIPSDAWVWSVTQAQTDPSSLRTVPLHPTQLYESLGDLVLAGLILAMLRTLKKEDRPWSQVFWAHMGGYALLRFALEFLHGDRDATVWASMTALQIGLLGFSVLSAIILLAQRGKSPRQEA